jgi:hypothetical protein
MERGKAGLLPRSAGVDGDGIGEVHQLGQEDAVALTVGRELELCSGGLEQAHELT